MRKTTIIHASVIVASLGFAAGSMIHADEVVQFSNGAEMTVQSHVVSKDMVKLELGGNNSISFPVSMIGKIVSAGQDVFRNPIYYPSNQAIAGVATNGAPAFASTGPMAGGRPRQAVPGQAGMRLGEAADGYQPSDNYGSGISSTRQNPHDDMAIAARPRLDPLRPLPLGGVATIDPPNAHGPVGKNAPRISPRNTPPPPANPPPAPAPPDQSPQGTSGSSDAGSNGQEGTSQGDESGTEPPPSQDPPPNR